VELNDEGVPVDVLIGVIKDSLRSAGISRTSGPGDLQVASIQLALNVVAAEAMGGRLNFCVPFIGMNFRLGAKVTRQDTHTIEITLVPPEEAAEREVRGDVEAALVDAITTIRAVMTSAASCDDPWALSSGEVRVSFVITREGSISLGIEGELAREISHTLRLSLKPS
jgi:hypothetical protein